MSSTLRVNSISDAAGANGNAITLATDGTCTAKITNNLSNRNLIINGSAIINQRGNSTGITGTPAFYGPDRWKTGIINYGTWSITQEADGPSGFANSIKLDCTTADASPAAADQIWLEYEIEAQDLQQLAYGTADAQACTLSFWVKSNLTSSQWNFTIQQRDNGGKKFQGTYTTHGTTNTWKKCSITIPADTAGVINNDNGPGLLLTWWLGGGSDYTGTAIATSWTASSPDTNLGNGITNQLGASTSNYIQFTGVQFELGSTATDFEHRSYGDELARCQRYYETSYGTGVAPGTSSGIGGFYSSSVTNGSSNAVIDKIFAVQKRTGPTLKFYRQDGTANEVATSRDGGSADVAATAHRSSQSSLMAYCNAGANWVGCHVWGFWTADSEL